MEIRYHVRNSAIVGLKELIRSRYAVDSAGTLSLWKQKADDLFFSEPLLGRFDRYEIRFDLAARLPVQIVQKDARLTICGSTDVEVEYDNRLNKCDEAIETITTKSEIRIADRGALGADRFHLGGSSVHTLVAALPETNGKYVVTTEDHVGDLDGNKPWLYLRLRRVMWMLNFLQYGHARPTSRESLDLP